MEGWQDMDGATLDVAYANADHIPGAAAFLTRWPARAAAFRASIGARGRLGLPYGPAPRAQFDLFLPEGAPAGVVVFVHGGYWRRFDRTDWSHLAAGPLARGWAVALPGYALAPQARIAEITRQVARAVDAIAAQVPGPMRLTGHSAGGHLVARMVMPDAGPACYDRIVACLPISPVAELGPLIPQAMNADLRLDPAEAAAESPARGRPRAGPRISIHVGADERPAFLWQAARLGDAWDAPVHVAPGRHHFDVIDDLSRPDSGLVDDLLA